MPRVFAAHRILKADRVMAGLIEAAGPCRLASHPLHTLRSPFESLARAIAHQQLHGVAAERILARMVALFGATGGFPSPQQVLEADALALRGAGFSFAKVAALKDLAAKTLAGIVPDAAQLESLTDLEIIERLTSVRGIGRWTVEMMLIFDLERPDVLPVDDFGIRNGFRLAYRLPGMPLPRALAEYGECWKPHRSMAAWYLWRVGELARADKLPRCARPPRIAVRQLASKVAPIRRRLARLPRGAKRSAARTPSPKRTARSS